MNMKKLILDPNLFEISYLGPEDELEHFLFLNNTIEFIAENFECSLDIYDGAPYGYNSRKEKWYPPITESLIMRSRYSEIRKLIQKLIVYGDSVELQSESVDSCTLQFEDDSAAKESFYRYLSHLIESHSIAEAVIILSIKNSSCVPFVQICHDGEDFQIDSILDPAVDCSGVVKKYLKLVPLETSAFPQKNACKKLNQRFREEDSTAKDKVPIYKKYGAEVASRNGYYKDTIRSKKNSHHVYKSDTEVYFLSLDMEHGAIELFMKRNNKVIHQGEYNYSCEKIKVARPSDHSLIL